MGRMDYESDKKEYTGGIFSIFSDLCGKKRPQQHLLARRESNDPRTGYLRKMSSQVPEIKENARRERPSFQQSHMLVNGDSTQLYQDNTYSSENNFEELGRNSHKSFAEILRESRLEQNHSEREAPSRALTEHQNYPVVQHQPRNSNVLSRTTQEYFDIHNKKHVDKQIVSRNSDLEFIRASSQTTSTDLYPPTNMLPRQVSNCGFRYFREGSISDNAEVPIINNSDEAVLLKANRILVDHFASHFRCKEDMQAFMKYKSRVGAVKPQARRGIINQEPRISQNSFLPEQRSYNHQYRTYTAEGNFPRRRSNYSILRPDEKVLELHNGPRVKRNSYQYIQEDETSKDSFNFESVLREAKVEKDIRVATVRQKSLKAQSEEDITPFESSSSSSNSLKPPNLPRQPSLKKTGTYSMAGNVHANHQLSPIQEAEEPHEGGLASSSKSVLNTTSIPPMFLGSKLNEIVKRTTSETSLTIKEKAVSPTDPDRNSRNYQVAELVESSVEVVAQPDQDSSQSNRPETKEPVNSPLKSKITADSIRTVQKATETLSQQKILIQRPPTVSFGPVSIMNEQGKESVAKVDSKVEPPKVEAPAPEKAEPTQGFFSMHRSKGNADSSSVFFSAKAPQESSKSDNVVSAFFKQQSAKKEEVKPVTSQVSPATVPQQAATTLVATDNDKVANKEPEKPPQKSPEKPPKTTASTFFSAPAPPPASNPYCQTPPKPKVDPLAAFASKPAIQNTPKDAETNPFLAGMKQPATNSLANLMSREASLFENPKDDRFKFDAPGSHQVGQSSISGFFSGANSNVVQPSGSVGAFFKQDNQSSNLLQSEILANSRDGGQRQNQGSTSSFFAQNQRGDNGNTSSFFGGQNAGGRGNDNGMSRISEENARDDRGGFFGNNDAGRGASSSSFFGGGAREDNNRSSFFGGNDRMSASSFMEGQREGRESNMNNSSSFFGGNGGNSGPVNTSFFGDQGNRDNNRSSFSQGGSSFTSGVQQRGEGSFFGGGGLSSREPEVNQHGMPIKRITRPGGAGGGKGKNFLNSSFYQ